MNKENKRNSDPCSLTFLLQVAATQAKLASRRQCLENPLSLTSDQALVIRTLQEEDGLVQGELARRTGKDAPCLSRILALLEKRGVVRKRKDEKDRRIWRVFLTEKACQVSSKLGCDLDETEKRLLGGLSSGEVETLRRMLWKVIENCREEFGVESSLIRIWKDECGCLEQEEGK